MAIPSRGSGSDGASSFPAPCPVAAETGTKGQWRLRRNLLIYLAFRQGFSSKFIADAFVLSSSVVLAILRSFSTIEAVGGQPPPRVPCRSKPGKQPEAPPDSPRIRRDELVRLGYREGFSQRFLADVFDLPRSRVAEILQHPTVQIRKRASRPDGTRRRRRRRKHADTRPKRRRGNLPGDSLAGALGS
jgi:hypothetical protein